MTERSEEGPHPGGPPGLDGGSPGTGQASDPHGPKGPDADGAPTLARGGARSQRKPAGGGGGIGHSLLLFLKEVVIVVVLAVVLSLILKTWFVQSFWIPSGSMNNTLVRDDRVSVSKLSPGVSDLNRGDIVVFEDPGGWLVDAPPPEQGPVAARINSALSWIGLLPNDEGNHLIKRIVGLPGDRVQCCTADGRLSVNGTPITEPYVYPGDQPSDTTFDITVPADKVWVMGDHRSNSKDSRYNDGPQEDGTNGSVPMDNVVGRAFAVVWPLSKLTWLAEPANTFARVPEADEATPSPGPSTPAGASSPASPSPSPARPATPSPVSPAVPKPLVESATPAPAAGREPAQPTPAS